MKAIEFIKKFGWTVTKDLSNMDNTSIGYLSVEHHGLNQQELKRYIDAYELVRKFGGIKRAKRILRKSYLSWNNRVSVVWNDNPFQCTIQQLEEAIALVEEVENFNG